ncbi:MAG: prepilin-type N-terminal cleavage/methylation domain-containing protein [Candidatus Riflebacteria bacterium]|nr:prepilin-type N-terminal cleavage/methylation domain-containing protein [Candidatus Riflebacteria bacterium]
MRRRAFTLTELLISMVLLSLALLPLLWMTTYSNRESMDAYYEIIAFSLAKEPIEVFRSFGYEWLTSYTNHPLTRFPIGTMVVKPRNTPDQYPFDSELFEREINIAQNDTTQNGIKARRVTVSVHPVKRSRSDAWLRRNEVKLEALIFDGPRM